MLKWDPKVSFFGSVHNVSEGQYAVHLSKSQCVCDFLPESHDFWLLKFFDEIFSGGPSGPLKKSLSSISTQNTTRTPSNTRGNIQTPSGGLFLVIQHIILAPKCYNWQVFMDNFRVFFMFNAPNSCCELNVLLSTLLMQPKGPQESQQLTKTYLFRLSIVLIKQERYLLTLKWLSKCARQSVTSLIGGRDWECPEILAR